MSQPPIQGLPVAPIAPRELVRDARREPRRGGARFALGEPEHARETPRDEPVLADGDLPVSPQPADEAGARLDVIG